MNLPESAAEPLSKTPKNPEAIIINNFWHKEKLTRVEALDCINHLSGALLADECYKSKKEHKKNL